MKILVLGVDGMLGHQIASSLSREHLISGTARASDTKYKDIRAYLPQKVYFNIDIRDIESVISVFHDFQPDAVINAVGIIKQRNEADNIIDNIEINALLPHKLARYCIDNRIKMVHFSTDCIFSGDTGNYLDDSTPDAKDIYGKTKYLGEVSGSGIVSLRTSIIGLELSRKKSLIEWFLAQRGSIYGYVNAVYTGFTTLEMARIVGMIVESSKPIDGIYNVSSSKISKFELLKKLCDRLKVDIDVIPEPTFKCDRSLISNRFRDYFSYEPPSWDEMLDELADQIQMRKRAGNA